MLVAHDVSRHREAVVHDHLRVILRLFTRFMKSNLDDVKTFELPVGNQGRRDRVVPGTARNPTQLRTFVDAAYGVHAAFKSSSGSTVYFDEEQYGS